MMMEMTVPATTPPARRRADARPGLAALASQQEDILDHLKRGEALCQSEARRLFGCSRLAARVWDLRQAGHPVRTRMVRDPDGRLVAEYYLETA